MLPALHPALRIPAQLLLVVVMALGLLLASPVGDAHAASRAKKISNATGIALNQKGDPYRYGAAGPSAFDCSGLIYYSFRKAGVSVPRTSGAQAGAVRRVAKSNLKRGDLMFFHNGGRVYHAAIFLGRSKGKVHMLHSPSSGKRVSKASPWTSSWFGGTLR
ncbi:C40 family peptidase [Nocardioides marmoraquaticus]